MPVQEKDRQRFWSKVGTGPGCWEWQVGTDSEGHGVFWLVDRNVGAHRAAWAIARKSDLGREYGVHKTTIRDVVTRRRWALTPGTV